MYLITGVRDQGYAWLVVTKKSPIPDINQLLEAGGVGDFVIFFCIFFGGLECVGQSFAYVAHFVFLRDVWIRTQRAAVASMQARYEL
jgi:hypothetical protein